MKLLPKDSLGTLLQFDNGLSEIAEIKAGLSLPQKLIPPKYFYDERGSELFEQICELPEYYLTRTEIGIMRSHIREIASCVGPQASVIEFGSGSGLKTRILLEHLARPAAYVPVDISADHLRAFCDDLSDSFPAIEILPTIADFSRPFPLPTPRRKSIRNLVYFPGSTIGNFVPEAAYGLLRVMYQEAAPGGALLVGVDLRKDRDVLERAYNDSTGITAEFNLNLLRRLNREYGADFDPAAFRHHAFFESGASRIEMHLVSQREQNVRLAENVFGFSEGEALVTEYSYKYELEQFHAMVERAGFTAIQTWTDPKRWFAIVYGCRD